MDKKQKQLIWLLIANICGAIIAVPTAVLNMSSTKNLNNTIDRATDIIVQCSSKPESDDAEFDLAKGE